MAEIKMMRHPTHGVMVERFAPVRRIEHLIVIATFVVLVITGLPQKVYDMEWAAWTLATLGGLDNARFIHRVAGIVFSVHAVVHIAAILVGVMSGKMRLTLLPVPQDLRDAWKMLGYYLGRERKPPDLPVFDYRQKFEYIGMALGGAVMVASGLALLFPVETASLVPAQLIPAARVMHSNEAMLAMLVLIVWHLYGSHLSPDIFPADTTIFTGYIPLEELRERHTLEYRRIMLEDGDRLAGHDGPGAQHGQGSEQASAAASPRGVET